MVELFIDDVPVTVPRNTTILQACDTVGIDVPRFCFHERLLIAGNCRMCLVEVSQFPNKPIASCTFPVGKDMKVYTRTPLVKKAQESVLEFLLLNHPLDCPICDQGGECDLQDQAMLFGSDSGRFYEYKRGVEDKNCGPLVKTIMTRCIHCTRCVRFATEIAGISDLGTTGRGKKTEIGTYVHKLIRSELSGNIIDLCPVGALTSKPYAFTARSWELKSTESIDIFDSIGSNIIINTKGNEVLRILPKFNEELNEEWITDKVRFSYDGLKKQRLSSPFLKTSKGFLERTNWRDILSLITDKILSSKSQIAMVSGSSTDLETLIVSKSLLNSLGSSSFFKKSGREFDKSNLDFPSSYQLNSSLPDLENCDLCVLVNINPRLEAPLLNTRLRKGVIGGSTRVAYIGETLDLTFKTFNLGFSKSTLVSLLEGRHPFCSEIVKSKNPVFIFGNNSSSLCFNSVSSTLSKNISSLIGSGPVFHFLNKDASSVGSQDLGLTQSYTFKDFSETKLLFLLNTHNFDFNLLREDCFVIYLGSHGVSDAVFSDIVLPGLSFSEKKTSYLNAGGLLQNTFRALFGPGDSRNDWEVFAALFCVLGYQLPFSGFDSLHKFYTDSSLIFKNDRQINPGITSSSFFPSEFVLKKNSIFNNGVKNFYSTGIITENSRIMAECSQSRLRTNFN
jgi:NADH dehydrogenase (ubiquinone) Fe-S protein 1